MARLEGLSSPVDWLSDTLIDKSINDLSSLKLVLAASGDLFPVIRVWIFKQIFEEMFSLGLVNIDDQDTDEIIGKSLQGSTQKDIFLLGKRLKNEYFRAAIAWAKIGWANSIESLYLKHNDKLGQAKYIVIASKSKNNLLEVFHQVRAGEVALSDDIITREKLAKICEIQAVPLTPLSNIPETFRIKIIKHREKKYIQPFPYKKGFAFLVIEEFSSLSLREESEEELIKIEFEEWIDKTTMKILNQI